MRINLLALAALAMLGSASATFAAGEQGNSGQKSGSTRACTFEICLASGIKHGWSPAQASNFCNRELPKGTACRNVDK